MSFPTQRAGIKQLAELVGASVHGDPEACITGIATLELASPNDLSFFSNRKYHKFLAETKAAIVILHKDDIDQCPSNAILADDPYLAYAKIATYLTKTQIHQAEIASSAVIGENVSIGENTIIGANVVIGNGCKISDNVVLKAGCVVGRDVIIGNNTLLYANVSVYRGVSIGENVIIHSGAVLGSDVFGIANENGQWFKVPQLGSVIIGNYVEIGANTSIDCGAIEDTIIEDGVKLDNLIQIAHNVQIGENTAIAGCVGIAGSTKIGKYCAIGGGAGILGHLTIADHVHITATSLVTKSIKQAGVYSSGTPLQENARWQKNFARFKQLDNLARRLTKLESKISYT